MASCFKCAVIDQSIGDADPIGVCKHCNSLSCVDHGTRLRKAAEFKCVLCVTRDMIDSAGLVRHDAYGEPPSAGDEGGVASPADHSSPDDGGGGSAREFDSPEDFRHSVPRIAEASSEHRAAAREITGRLVAKVEELDDKSVRDREIRRLAVTSDPATLAAFARTSVEVIRELREAQRSGRLDLGLLADALGVASWAINAPVGETISADAIALIPDERLRFLLRAWSEYFARVAG